MELYWPSENLIYYRELIRCSFPAEMWVYNSDGTFLGSTSPSTTSRQLLEKSGSVQYAVDCLEDGTPIVLSSMLGIIWGAAYERDGDATRIHIVGPAVNRAIPLKKIEATARKLVSGHENREEFIRFFSSVPVLPLPLFQHYLLMLHYSLNGSRLDLSDIRYQQKKSAPESAEQEPKKDRQQTYMAEQRLLYHIREGNLNYQEALEQASSISYGIKVQTDNPIQQAIISTTSFATLCTRAAIEGGLPPDTAYTIGDMYIQSMIGCKAISDLAALNHTMYEDFIQRVHKARQNTKLSKPVADCVEYIQLHPEDDITISSLAEYCGYSDYYLSRKFKQEMGQTVNSYLNAIRIERAKMLLETTKDSVTQIAERLHYCSSTHFSDSFKRIVGKLPTEYRKETARCCI